MFSLGEVLKSLSSLLWLCVIFLMAVSLPAPARPQPHLCQGCVSYPALLAIGVVAGTTVEMLALAPRVALGYSEALVLEFPG